MCFKISMNIGLFWDKSFKNRFGDDSEINARIVLLFASNAYRWKSTLKTTIEIKVEETGYKDFDIKPSVTDL